MQAITDAPHSSKLRIKGDGFLGLMSVLSSNDLIHRDSDEGELKDFK